MWRSRYCASANACSAFSVIFACASSGFFFSFAAIFVAFHAVSLLLGFFFIFSSTSSTKPAVGGLFCVGANGLGCLMCCCPEFFRMM